MKKKNRFFSALAVVLCFGLNANSTAAALIGDQAVVFGWSSAGAGTDTMRGWQFSTNAPVEVTALGVFDHWNPNGLIGEHEVVIWDSNNQVVAQATVPAGTTATKIDRTRYIEITTCYARGRANIPDRFATYQCRPGRLVCSLVQHPDI